VVFAYVGIWHGDANKKEKPQGQLHADSRGGGGGCWGGVGVLGGWGAFCNLGICEGLGSFLLPQLQKASRKKGKEMRIGYKGGKL